ncbi:hypothetical protein ACFVIM_33335 [Streptomyces sp. NPDC057638]|uniref:hypothetical protein n=1 Tax=Streptomyces sp. NPDC057638 TaxID=3346190 RepID=UPI0036BC0C76
MADAQQDTAHKTDESETGQGRHRGIAAAEEGSAAAPHGKHRRPATMESAA